MKYLLVFIACFSFTVAFGQKMPETALYRTRINLPDGTIVLETNPVNTDPEIYPERLYYWYSSNAVHQTQGGFSGRLLNGNYTAYYSNKNLKEQGVFKKGLKTAVWKRWNEKGYLLELATWQAGIRSGNFTLFDEQGNILQSGTYKDNLLDGKIKTYLKDSVSIINYKAGKPVKTASGGFWKKINIFKKKAGTSGAPAVTPKQK